MNDAEKLAKEHWAWFSQVLEVVYMTAFVHGYKHAKEGEK